jgi:hypothetical protein
LYRYSVIHAGQLGERPPGRDVRGDTRESSAGEVSELAVPPPSVKVMMTHLEHADRSPWRYGVCDQCQENARSLSSFDLSVALSEVRRSVSTFEKPVLEAILDEAARRIGMAADGATTTRLPTEDRCSR